MQARSLTNCKALGRNSVKTTVAPGAGVVALLVGCYAPISARADNIDDYASARMRQLHIPGLSLAIVRDGRIARARGYGFANLELKARAAKETVYEIGSNTKQFTAAAIMILVKDGKLHLEGPLTEYFPEAPQAWRNITIRHLLTHTSGIQNHVALPHWLDIFKTNLSFETSPSRDELLSSSNCSLSFSQAKRGPTITLAIIYLESSSRKSAENLTGNF